MSINKQQIVQAIKTATGAPDSGPVAAVTNDIADAIDALINPSNDDKNSNNNKTEKRILKPADETRDSE